MALGIVALGILALGILALGIMSCNHIFDYINSKCAKSSKLNEFGQKYLN